MNAGEVIEALRQMPPETEVIVELEIAERPVEVPVRRALVDTVKRDGTIVPHRVVICGVEVAFA